jgi:hypothetical protein
MEGLRDGGTEWESGGVGSGRAGEWESGGVLSTSEPPRVSKRTLD